MDEWLGQNKLKNSDKPLSNIHQALLFNNLAVLQDETVFYMMSVADALVDWVSKQSLSYTLTKNDEFNEIANDLEAFNGNLNLALFQVGAKIKFDKKKALDGLLKNLDEIINKIRVFENTIVE